ncbi:amidase-like isoform X2 [Dreissena polymorpha]|uniref:Amidase domain-containing protein n=1 Tax=Dreissena polymorpha TaxID=45954 RepID=A0A9D4RZ16_DREPO|nr:amidase-like isoform X2 [Dreissena polymorpha]KAH3886349.1 hypothetical protein DPMN_010355 [Dreissena polymorpha]
MLPGMFKTSAVRCPQAEEVRELCRSIGLRLDKEQDVQDFTEHMAKTFEAYQVVSDSVAPTLLVKYPRTPGYRPEPNDNKHNAWYWRCDIPGAPEGLLKGKRVGIKDNVCVAGVPMLNGSRLLEGYIPDIDASVVTRILDAGGRILGKTHCEHMCYSGSSFTNDTGPTQNPVDPERSSGGSSSGSAVAIKNGDVDMAIGGDQGGSIRIPASWVGIVGLKPTYGLVPYTGAISLETTIDHLGPMAANVKDCALLLEAIAGYDSGLDSRQPSTMTCGKYSELLEVDLSGKRMGLLAEGFAGCEQDVQNIVREAARKLGRLGVNVEEVSLPLHKEGVAIWTPIAIDGAYQCMVKGFGVGYMSKGYYNESLMKKLRESFALDVDKVSDPVKLMLLMGSYMEKNYGGQFYARAQNLCIKLTRAYDALLETYDVLVMPTLPYKAPKLPCATSRVSDRLNNALGMIQNTAPFDISGHPAISINAGFSENLPVGLQIVGAKFADLTVLQFAAALEKLIN